MKKITIKHYINKKLNSTTIKGENYFCIYVRVTANRKTTKVRSNIFNELYTEIEFKREQEKDNNKLFEETETIRKIIETQINLYNDFDTILFSAFFNFADKFKVNTTYFCDIDGEKIVDVNTYYDIFKPANQQKIIDLNLNPFETIEEFNKAYFILFFDILNVISKTNKKYECLGIKYKNECDNPTALLQKVYLNYNKF